MKQPTANHISCICLLRASDPYRFSKFINIFIKNLPPYPFKLYEFKKNVVNHEGGVCLLRAYDPSVFFELTSFLFISVLRLKKLKL